MKTTHVINAKSIDEKVTAGIKVHNADEHTGSDRVYEVYDSKGTVGFFNDFDKAAICFVLVLKGNHYSKL